MLLLTVALAFGNEPTPIATEEPSALAPPASELEWTAVEKTQWREKHRARLKAVTPLLLRSEHVQAFLTDLSGLFVVVDTEIEGSFNVVRVEPIEILQGSLHPNDEIRILFDTTKPHEVAVGSEIIFHAWRLNKHSYTVEMNRLYIRQEDDTAWTAEKHHLVSIHPHETWPSLELEHEYAWKPGSFQPPPADTIGWADLVAHMRAVTPVGKSIRDEAGL